MNIPVSQPSHFYDINTRMAVSANLNVQNTTGVQRRLLEEFHV